jgi:hypothetical protein
MRGRARLLENWHADMMENAGSTVDPLWVVLEEGGPYHARGHLEDYLVRLEATGRHEGAAALRERWLKNG